MDITNKHILVVEDSKYSMYRIQSILKNVPNITIIGAKNSGEAYRYALEYSIDLFIVDIMLDSRIEADISGINFAETIRGIDRYEFTPIIFTTSLEDPGLYTYANVHCYKYFEKPYDEEEFLQTVTKLLRFEQSSRTEKKYYCYREDGVLYFINTKEIVYIHNQLTKLYIMCENGEVVQAPYRSCKSVLLELNSDRFFKCNKNLIVNLDFVRKIDSMTCEVILKGEYGKFAIGRIFLRELMGKMNND